MRVNDQDISASKFDVCLKAADWWLYNWSKLIDDATIIWVELHSNISNNPSNKLAELGEWKLKFKNQEFIPVNFTVWGIGFSRFDSVVETTVFEKVVSHARN